METVFCEDIPLDRNSECYEFNIGKAGELSCSQTIEGRDCGECEVCLLTQSLISTRNWFWRCSDQVKKRFLVGLVQRYHSVDLLKYTVQLLKPLIGKDFTYARSRIVPSLETDSALSSSDRALDMAVVDKSIKYTWNWFVSSNYWTKSNFILGLFKICDSQLLFTVGNLAKTMLSSEVKALAHRESQHASRVSSAALSSKYSNFDDRPVTAPEIIRSAQQGYRVTSAQNIRSKRGPRVGTAGEIMNDDSEEDEDPTLFVAPASEKALVGVTKYRDFIKELPVHISKSVLGYLDEATLFNCSKVSKHWHLLVEEMRAEFYANQQMWEDIMLMQGSSGVHVNYANDIDVLVPNVKPDTQKCIRRNGEVEPEPKVLKDERFKSEMTFENAYAGYSTRKVIMEERNVYCGSYNVLVLVNEHNKDRVVHTSGGNFLPYSKDRRCHLIDISMGRDTERPIAGHSGSIKCIYIQEDEGFLLTGSFDTSIRKWDLSTLKCSKIYNGHQDTIVALAYCPLSKRFASACYDKSCKVWDLNKKKCYRTFKHRARMVAVALSEAQCITGCEQGRVKVWDIESGVLIKMLLGHEKVITSVRFDKWHIITASHDGYVLTWSNQGNHKRCLTALRHPCPVLCMEFLYLRVLTGAEDGRVRIWNVINGQCCRIMRGNSQSDPVLDLYANGDRLTINTKTNVLMLTFEAIEWDYSYESDKVVSLVDNNKYPDAPLRQYPYAYIRAQRMAHSGSADTRLINKAEKPRFSRTTSARSNSSMFCKGSKAISTIDEHHLPKKLTMKDEPDFFSADPADQTTLDRAVSAPHLEYYQGQGLPPQSALDKRRVSWAFERPEIPTCPEPSLLDMKALLKKQIRNTVRTPDFIYLTVSALKNQVLSTYPYEYSNNSEFPQPNRPQSQMATTARKPILKNRPQSSPSSIDSKTKVNISEGMAEFIEEAEVILEEAKSVKSGQTYGGRTSGNRSIRSSRNADKNKPKESPAQRAKSAQLLRVKSAGGPRCQSAGPSSRATTPLKATQTRKGLTTTATETNIVPMLMYPKGGLKTSVSTSNLKKWPSQESIAQNHPLNAKHSLKLMTYTQESNLNLKSHKAQEVR